MSRDSKRHEADPIVAERIREALKRPIEEKQKLDLPKIKPVDELKPQRSLKPAPRIVRKKVPR